MENPFGSDSRGSVFAGSTILSPIHSYAVTGSNMSTSFGSFGHANPGTRETILVATRMVVPHACDVQGIYLPCGAMTNGTEFKVRYALFEADGDVWGGVAATNTALPATVAGGLSTTTGVNFSTGRTNAGGATLRAFRFNFASPARIEPALYWVVMAYEALYAGGTPDVAWSTTFNGVSTPIGYLHESAGTAHGGNLIYKNVIAGGIDSFAWADYQNLPTADWLNVSSTTTFTTDSAAKTWTGGVQCFYWNLITRPT